VVGPKLFDANGNEFVMRGSNTTHVDQASLPMKTFKANTNRFINYFSGDPDRVLRDMQSSGNGYSTASGKVQIPGLWDGTCKSDAANFNKMVDVWVHDAKKYQTVERTMLLNIANEWGDDENAWRAAYVAAIPRIRDAGWNGAIVVDAPGCGQNGMAIARQGAAILAADPQKNVVFDWHIYGLVYDSVAGINKQWAEQIDLLPTMNALAATKLAIVVGEIGPGRNIGPSPTSVKPERIVKLAEERGFGWLLWSHDDNDGANSSSSETSFGMFKTNNVYTSDADLTQWGRTAKALWEQYSTPASIFR
jgi:mannan endo-1,4-beta-mannosidase